MEYAPLVIEELEGPVSAFKDQQEVKLGSKVGCKVINAPSYLAIEAVYFTTLLRQREGPVSKNDTKRRRPFYYLLYYLLYYTKNTCQRLHRAQKRCQK